MSPPQTKRATLRRDLTLSYVERGDPLGTPVVLLHGYTDSWRSYEPLMVQLPRTCRVIAISQRGHGDSSKPEGSYDVGDFAADVGRVMDVLRIERAVIVGHSMGSVVAQRFALDHPERVLGLVLLGAAATFMDNAAVAELWRDVAAIADPVDPSFVRAFQESTLARPVPAPFLDTIVAESLQTPARVWRTALQSLRSEDLSGAVHRIAAPTLIVWGDRDAICGREDQDWLEGAIASSTLIVHRGAGHAPHWEDPNRVSTTVGAFIDAEITALVPAMARWH